MADRDQRSKIDLENISRLRSIAFMEKNNGHDRAVELYKKLANEQAKSVAKILFQEEPTIEDPSLRDLAEKLRESTRPQLRKATAS